MDRTLQWDQGKEQVKGVPQILSRGPGRRETSTELSPWALRKDRSTVHKGRRNIFY